MNPIDWALLAASLIFIVSYGIWKGRKSRDLDHYFLSNRDMRWPVVAFSMPAFKTMIESGKNGLLCGEPSEFNLIPALETLLDSPEIRRQYGVAARRRAEDFSWEKITKRIIDYYHEVKQAKS